MAVNNKALLIGKLSGKQTAFPTASSSTVADITTLDATYDTRIDSFMIACNDTVVNQFNISFYDAASQEYVLANISVPIGAGSAALGAVPAVNVLASSSLAGFVQYDGNSNPFLHIPAGWKLRGAFNVALTTAGKFGWVSIRGGRYSDS